MKLFDMFSFVILMDRKLKILYVMSEAILKAIMSEKEA